MSQQQQRRVGRIDLAAASVAGLAALALLGLPLLFGQYYFGLDLTQANLGVRCAIRNLVAGEGQLWLSPLLGNGAPLLLRPEAGLFYPLRWLTLWLPLDAGASLEAILHLALAAAGACWLGRTFGLRPATAVAAGLLTALSGTFLDLLLHTSVYAIGAAWLPFAWAAARRALHPGRRPGAPVIAGIALALLLLGGESQSFGIALVIAASETGLRLLRAGRRALGRVVPLALALASGALVGCALWVGYWVEARLSVRGGPLELEEVVRWSFEPALWPALLLPGRLFSEPLPHASLWLLAQRGSFADTVWNPSPYLGPLLLAALIAGFWQRRTRLAAVVASGGLLLALGDSTPLLGWLTELLPPLAFFRYPQKFLVVTTLAAVIVAVGGMARLQRQRTRWRRFAVAGSALIAGCLLAALAVTVWRGAIDALTSDLTVDMPAVHWPSLAALLRWSLVRALAPLALALLVGALWPRWRRWRRWLPWLPWIAVADLALAGAGAVHLGPALAELPSPLAALADDGPTLPPLLCVAAEPEPDPAAADATSYWQLLALRRQQLSSELQACSGLGNANPYMALQTSANRLLQAALLLGHRSAARALGCTHVIDAGVDAGDGAVQPLVERIESPIPLAFVAAQPQLARSEVELLGRVFRTRSAEQALAVVDDPLHRLSRQAELPTGTEVEVASLDWPRRDRAAVELAGSGGAVVGLRTSFQVGWHARQAGRELPVIRASGQHLAAIVDEAAAGPITFEYRPPRFGLSCALAALGVGGLVALAWWRRRYLRSSQLA